LDQYQELEKSFQDIDKILKASIDELHPSSDFFPKIDKQA
jgi:hypothetical protein